ncbi:MmgE/PrpD family protein [Brevibacillus marinus]|uniref:MmgE/PrpD family protein n=1 Tax=Brevibacillus marinus TaxID=2496837 RepID=UPI0013DE8DB9|nr:MmgE/PrpD family protein [Brevibacillus marinus]
MSQTLSEKLASFVCRLDYAELPARVVEKAKTCLIHGIGVGLAGYQTDFPRIAADIAKKAGTSDQQATLLYDGSTAAPMEAAFANAVLFHSRVQEDTHNTAHLGTVVIPVALALGEAGRKSGKELLSALVAGYEVGGALSKHYTAYTTPRGFRASSVYGIFAATAAAAKLLGLSEIQTVHALGFAASFAFGTLEAFTAGSMEWRFENGLAAKNGLLSALLAQHGAVATRYAFEGKAGFLHAFAGNREEPLKCAESLGKAYELMNVTFKLYPVCAFNQTPVINTLQLTEERDIPLEQIEAITIEMNEYEANYPGMSAKGPFANISQTLMSAPYCVAVALLEKDVTLANLQKYDHAELNRLIAKTTVLPSRQLQPLSSKISIRLHNGQVLVREMNISEEYYNLGIDQDIQLIRGLIGEMPIGRAQLDQLIDDILHLEEIGDTSVMLHHIADRSTF